MDEYDNGLPPEGIDASDFKINEVSIKRRETTKRDVCQLVDKVSFNKNIADEKTVFNQTNSVSFKKSKPEEYIAASNKTGAVSLHKEITGNNFGIFL